MYSMATYINNTILHLEVAKKIDLKCSHHKKTICNYCDVNQSYCGDHFARYTNTKPLCYTTETNAMFCVNNISIKKKKQLWPFFFL